MACQKSRLFGTFLEPTILEEAIIDALAGVSFIWKKPVAHPENYTVQL